jgi:enoyl-CoA hydratase/carnithine racemase
MSASETVLVRREGAATTIVLNRPDALNAWNVQLGTELLAAVRDAAADPGVRAVARSATRPPTPGCAPSR